MGQTFDFEAINQLIKHFMNISATKRQIGIIIAGDLARLVQFRSDLGGVTFRGPLSNAHEYFTQMANI